VWSPEEGNPRPPDVWYSRRAAADLASCLNYETTLFGPSALIRLTYYVKRLNLHSVIRSFADGKTRRLFEDGRRRGFRGLDYDRALMLLDALDAAASLEPLRVLRAARLHALTGSRRRRWAMTVNERWRVTFRFEGGDAHDVAVEDYHRG